MFKRFIDWLYVKYGSKNWVALTRTQLQGVTFEHSLEDLSDSERKDIAKEAQTILDSAVFKLAVNNVKARVEAHIRNEAPTAEVIFFDRMTINGVFLLEEELNSYLEVDEETAQEFDKYESL